MITKKEFNCILSLMECENQLLYRLYECERDADEPQLKEEFQKLTASVNNQKSELINALEVKNVQ